MQRQVRERLGVDASTKKWCVVFNGAMLVAPTPAEESFMMLRGILLMIVLPGQHVAYLFGQVAIDGVLSMRWAYDSSVIAANGAAEAHC